MLSNHENVFIWQKLLILLTDLDVISFYYNILHIITCFQEDKNGLKQEK